MIGLPILYSFRRCPYAIRARLTICVSQTSCHLREVFLRDKPEEMILISPKATVPVMLQANGRVIDQSLDIMLTVLNNNDPEGWIGTTEQQLKQMLQLIEETEMRFKPHLDRYKYSTRYDNCDPLLERWIAGKFLFELDDLLSHTSYLFGSETLLADAAIAPFVRQFAQSDRPWFDDQSWTYLSAWLQAFEKSDLFSLVMRKNPAWKPGDDETLFP